MRKLSNSDRQDKLIALCQYAAFLQNLRTAAALLKVQSGDIAIGVMTPFGEARAIRSDSPVSQVLAEVMFQVGRLRGELSLPPLTPEDMATPEAFDAAIWKGVDSVMGATNARSRYAH